MPKSDGSHIHQQFSLLGYPSNPSSTGILQDLYPADLRTVQVAYKPPRSTPKSYKPERLVSRQLRRGRKELDEDKSSYEGSSLSRDSVQPQHKPQKPTLKSYKTYDSEKSSLSRDSVQAHKQPQPTLKSYKGYKPRTFVSRQSPGGSRELNEDKGSYDGSSISRESVWAQPLTYDNLRTYDTHKHYSLKKPEKVGWSRRRKVIVCGSIATFVIVVVIIVGVAVVLSRKGTYKYTESYAHVTSSEAFKTGGATHTSPQDVDDGIGAGADKYVYYSGDASDFPIHTSWVSFGNMLQANLHTLQTSCSVLGYGKDNSKVVIEDIYEAIQNRANASLVDHRFIFAVILQESNGCVRVGETTSSGGVTNPGLMQTHNGHSYSASHSSTSILAMVQDGTQGTASGNGLVQNLNIYGNAYSAARGYNSGYIPKSGNLSEAAGATACYVSDIANRLTGWVTAKSTCAGD